MTITDFILYVTLIIFVLYITRINNMWGVSRATSKAKKDVRSSKSFEKRKNRHAAVLRKFVWVAQNVGHTLTTNEQQRLQYKIDRLGIRSKVLDKNYKPNEIVGIFRTISIVSAFLLVVFIVLTKNPICLAFIVFIFGYRLFNVYADLKIADEDRELDEDFPDFYLILYSRLIKGTSARIAPALNDYLVSLDAMASRDNKVVMRRFVMDLRANIDLLGSDDNLAVQALRGVDNKDKLLSFKLELNQKRLEQMRKRADKMMAKGGRVILLMYVILAQFIGLSFWAKLSLSLGGVKYIFGL